MIGHAMECRLQTMVQRSSRPTVELSRRLMSTTVWNDTASGTKLLRKIAPFQPVGWSAMLGRLAYGLNGYHRFARK
jgi:hypothetical protein